MERREGAGRDGAPTCFQSFVSKSLSLAGFFPLPAFFFRHPVFWDVGLFCGRLFLFPSSITLPITPISASVTQPCFQPFSFFHTHFPLLTVCSTPLSIRNGSGGEAAHEISGDIQIEVMPKAIRLCLIDEILPKYMDRQTCKTDVPSISSTKT